MMNFQIAGMRELQQSLQRLGKVPQKHVTAAAKKGMKIALKQAKKDAPMLTGELKDGTILVPEKTKRSKKGKKVYRIVFDRKKNSIFQKRNASGDINGYYPISQEYGYFTKSGRYIPGTRYIHEALLKNKSKIEKTIVSTMKQKIDKQIIQEGLR